jgi:hypothetical protein
VVPACSPRSPVSHGPSTARRADHHPHRTRAAPRPSRSGRRKFRGGDGRRAARPHHRHLDAVVRGRAGNPRRSGAPGTPSPRWLWHRRSWTRSSRSCDRWSDTGSTLAPARPRWGCSGWPGGLGGGHGAEVVGRPGRRDGALSLAQYDAVLALVDGGGPVNGLRVRQILARTAIGYSAGTRRRPRYYPAPHTAPRPAESPQRPGALSSCTPVPLSSSGQAP